MKKLFLICLLSVLSACASRSKEPQFTNVTPQADPLSAELSRATQPNSTVVLKKADQWLLSSGQLLDSVTNNSGSSEPN